MENLEWKAVIIKFEEFKESHLSRINEEQLDFLDELISKLNNLSDLSKRIIERTLYLNMSEDVPYFDSKTDTLAFHGVSIKLNRADQFVPISIGNMTKAFPKKMASDGERDLALDTEQFYYVAHRLIKIGPKIKLLGSEKEWRKMFKDILLIRNHLLEHPESKESGVTYDSFGYTNYEGPVIKAMRKEGQNKFPDRGFISNSKTMIDGLLFLVNKS